MNSHLTNIKTSANIFFMRHAETVANRDHIVSGSHEVELSEGGILQAKKTGEFFRDKDISLLLHSPLSRTKKTADCVFDSYADADKPRYELCKDLLEMDSGDWTFKTLADVEKEFPEQYAKFKIHSWESVPNAEKVVSLTQRGNNVWAHIAKYIESGHTNILAVSHGGFINWILKTSFGNEGSHLATWSPIVKTNNCGIYELQIEAREEGAFCIWKRINHTCYN